MRRLDIILLALCSLSLAMHAIDKLPARISRPAPRPPIVRPAAGRYVF